MATESQIIRQRMDEGPRAAGPQFDGPITIEGQPFGDFLGAEQAAQAEGQTLLTNDDGSPFDPDAPVTLFEKGPAKAVPGKAFTWNKVHLESIISGDPMSIEENKAAVQNGADDITSYLTETLLAKYNDKNFDSGVLEGIRERSPEEQLARLTHEANKLDLAKEETKFLLALQMQRQGFGSLPTHALDQTWASLEPIQLELLRDSYRQRQRDDLQAEIDTMAAAQSATGGQFLGEIVQQDLIPFYGAITRVISTNKFRPEDLDMSNIRAVMPGEVRQEIREWFAQASQKEKLDYIRDISLEFEALKKGPMSGHFTRYGIIENLMGVFTDDLLEDNIPKDTLDRVLGNLDVLLGGVIAVGAIAKRGTSIFGLFNSNKISEVYNATSAANNHQAVNQINSQIARMADELGVPKAELAITELPRPAGIGADLDVLPDEVKQVIAQIEPRRQRILDNTDRLTGQGLTEADKEAVTRSFIAKLNDADGIHPNHRMTTHTRLPNDTGIRVSVVYGQQPGQGWADFGDMVDDLMDIDKNLDTFEILKRGPDGKLVKVDVSVTEIAKFVTKGEVPVVIEQGLDPFSATTRLFGGRRLTGVSNTELLEVAKTIDPASTDFDNIMRVMSLRRTGESPADVLTSLDGEEFFLRRTEDRFWATTDKDNLNTSFAHTWQGPLADTVLAPNAKFADDIVGAVQRADFIEANTRAEFSQIYKPFFDLGTSDKIMVGRLFEWAEDHAKDIFGVTGQASAPTMLELMDHFPHLTNKQLKGYVAVRAGQDIQYELFNRRLYRNFTTQGFKTARSVDGSAPNYHGAVLERVGAGTYFDPFTGQAKAMSKADIDEVVDNGGSFMKLEIPIDGPLGSGKFDTIIIRQGDYEVGDLAKNPLNYYEGYTTRFYEDPHYILKHTTEESVNGTVVKGESTEAFRTAGSKGEADRFLARMGKRQGRTRQIDKLGRIIDPDNPNVSYSIQRSQNLANTEGTLFQSQSLHREGRLFWDERQRKRLPDVHGNKAKIADVQQTLEKGTALAIRQATHEDLFRTLKNAFQQEFGDIPEVANKLGTDDVGEVIVDLKRARANATSPEYKKRLDKAISLAKYMQTQMGTDTFLVPALRQALVSMAEHVSTIGGGRFKAANRFGGWLESKAAQADPFRFARSIAFNTFMVFRPIRQLALQSLQISYLTSIDPAYIATGRVITDGIALRRGLAQSRRAGFDDGWSDSAVAKIMGLSKKEYKRLVEEFDRSGLFDSVNVHAFNPNAGMATRAKLSDTLPGRFMYHARTQGRKMQQLFAQGFNIGETQNLTMTYMVAVRRALKENKFKSITQLSREQFDKITLDASNLALAMTKANKFSYQSGATGTMFQFLSFSHKALLGMFGQNPALKGKGFRILMASYGLYGANIFGAEDYIREQLSKIGITGQASQEIMPGLTLQDLLTAGLVESIFNTIGHASSDEFGSLNLGAFAPGANIQMIYEEFLSGVVEGNIKLEALGGPSAMPIAAIMKAWSFTSDTLENDTRSPTQKILDVAQMSARNIFPQVNDANRAWYAYQTGIWNSKSGDRLPTKAAMSTILARGLMGLRPADELSLMRMKTLHWKQQENIDNIVKGNQEYLKELFQGWQSTAYDEEYIRNMIGSLMSLYEDAPEGVRMEIFKRSMLEGTEDSPSVVHILAEIAAKGSFDMESFIPHIEKQTNITPQEKAQTVQLIKEISRGYKEADERFKQLQEGNR